ncbi:MAG TPA: hypothetical protein VMN81_13955 [Vicinamibacterales bacterium]|nr:hypothetical protein [Vicinamibacterales bacterium]
MPFSLAQNKVDVRGEPYMAVRDDRQPANDEISNARGVVGAPGVGAATMTAALARSGQTDNR